VGPAPACETPFCGASLPSWGSAIAVGDVDGDNLPDLLLGAVGPRRADLGPVTLLRNLGGMRFAPITRCAGLRGYGATVALFADLDNDGDQDLVLGGRPVGPASERGDVLVFEYTARRYALRRTLTVDSPGAPTALDVTDLDRDGLADIVVGRGGTDRNGHYPASIYLGRPGLHFEDRSNLVDNHGFAWVAAATDLDDDGAPDLLFLHDGFATFEAPPGVVEDGVCRAPRLAPHPDGLQRDWHNVAWRSEGAAGEVRVRPMALGARFEENAHTPMGIAIADFDGDGHMDYVTTNLGDPLYAHGPLGRSSRQVYDTPGLLNLSPAANPSSGWSALARDLDRDGREDLVMTWGVVPSSNRNRGNTVLRGLGREGFAYVPHTGLERPERVWSGLALADFDGDGDDDAVLGGQTTFTRSCDTFGPARLYENRTPRGDHHWLKLRLQGTVSTRDALGARVEVSLGARTISRVVSGVGGTSSAGNYEVDLGTGALRTVPWLRVRWPSGAVQRLENVRTDRVLPVQEPPWLRTVGDGANVQVIVDLSGLAEVGGVRSVNVALRGDAQWVQPLAGVSPGRWQGLLRARRDASLVVRAEGTSLHAARWLRGNATP
jgi:hypothetical protein